MNPRRSLRLGLAIISGFWVVAPDLDLPAATAATQHIRLAGRDFEIPDRYLEGLGQPPWWLRLLPGLDSGSREALLLIDASEVAAAVPGYEPVDGGYRDNLQIRLVVLTAEERQRYEDALQFADIWNSAGSYHDRIVERDAKTGFFDVYRRVEYPDSWEIFKISPISNPIPHDVFSFWIGHCLNTHSHLAASGVVVDCDSYALVGDVAVNFRTSGQNISLVPKIRDYLAGLVAIWERQ